MKGTVAVTADSTTVTGTGTLFDSQFIVGDKITINGETKKVKTLTSNTVIVTDKKFLALQLLKLIQEIGNMRALSQRAHPQLQHTQRTNLWH